jgi:hypothetical protein
MSLLLLFGGAPAAPPETPAIQTGLQTTVQLQIASVWTDVTTDVLAIDHLKAKRGISRNTPLDALADSGRLVLSLRNDANNAAGLLGRYSPLHANVLPGWTFGIPIRVVWQYEDALSVSSLTRSGSTATAQTSADHGLDSGDYVEIAGAVETDYNGYVAITVTGLDTFTYQVAGTPSTPATGTITAQRAYVKFTGKVSAIEPEPGEYGSRNVRVIAYDRMRDLLDSDVRDVVLQEDKYEDDVTHAVLDAAPSGAQPTARNIDPGLDLMQFALYDLGAGTKIGAVLSDICRSTHAIGFVQGDDTYRQISRNTRALTTSSYAFVDTMHGLKAPSTLGNVYNHVRTISHPMSAPTSAVVLCAMTGTPAFVPAGATATFELSYRDASDPRRLIGGRNVVTVGSPPVLEAGVDYEGNSQDDGQGTDLTGTLSVSVAAFATRAVFTVTNSGGTGAYLVTSAGAPCLKLRGAGVYDDGPRTASAMSAQAYGNRPIDIDLPYQSDDTSAQQIAELILDQYDDLAEQVESLTILGNYSAAYMRQALARDIGDIITITETVTGMAGVPATIRACEYELIEGDILRVTWSLGPTITITPPNPPTSLTATEITDSAVTVAWSTGTTGAATQVLVDGVHVATAQPGETSLTVYGLAPATTYTFSARHIYFGLTSVLSNTDTARPVVVATGGTVTTPGDGYQYHTFTTSGTFTISTAGRIDAVIVSAGGGGGRGVTDGSGDIGGGGGGGGGVLELLDDLEPVGAHAVGVGVGGPAGAADGNNGTQGADSSYRTHIPDGGGYGGGGLRTGNVGGDGGNGGGSAADDGLAGGNPTFQGGAPGYTGGASGNNPGGSSGGGGGASAAGDGNAGVVGTGGAIKAGYTSVIDGLTYSRGGSGGRGTSPAAKPANSGDGGDGSGPGEAATDGGSGKVVIRYPI